MNKCKNCKFWDADGNDYSEAINAKRCKRIQHSEGTTEWDEDHNNVMKKEFVNDLAFACDGSGYYACLVTKSDFFCAHWEEKS